MYYETVPLDSSDERRLYEGIAGEQELVILKFMDRHHMHAASASYLWKTLFTPATPITSVRRALTNLAQKGYIEKTTEKVEGLWGRKELTWKFRPQYAPGEQLKLPLPSEGK